MFQDNFYTGRPLLSNYRSLSGGVFALERLILGTVELEVGARYDQESRSAYILRKPIRVWFARGGLNPTFARYVTSIHVVSPTLRPEPYHWGA